MTFHVFISHAYGQRKLYNSIVYRFEDQDDFDWYDCSVPRHRRYGTAGSEKLSDAELRELLKEHIARCDVVIAIAKPVATRREWIRWELEYAKSLGKPIIAVWRRNVDLRVSSFVLRLADLKVDTWNIRTIMRAVAEAKALGQRRTAIAEAEALARATAAMKAEDQDTTPLAVSTDAAEPVAPASELALSDEEKSALPPRQVIGPNLDAARQVPADAKIAVADAVEKLGGAQAQQAAAETPRDALPKPRWWQFWKRPKPDHGVRPI